MKFSMFTLFAVCPLLIISCKNNSSQQDEAKKSTLKDSVAKEQSFFPVPDYIGGELKIIDSLQLPISKTVTINGKDKLYPATDKELRELAQNFRRPDISDSSIKKFYTETNIADQSVPSVTLIYATSNSTLPVQKINVYIKPSPVDNDKVTGIYMEKAFSKGDTVFNQKLYWKTGKNMQINTEKQLNGKTLPVEQIKLTWDY